MQVLKHTWIPSGPYKIHTVMGIQGVHTQGQPPVVLVHGLGVSSRYMNRLAGLLAKQYPVFALDLPGFGKSSASHTLSVDELTDALAQWMEDAGLYKAVMVGNSFGCQVIANLCIKHPNKVLGCVLQGPSVDRHACSKIRQVSRFLYDGLFEDPSIIPIIIRDFIDCGFVRLWKTFDYMMHDKIEEKLPHIEVPTLIVSGTSDPVTPPYWARELAQLTPDGQLLIFKGAPHAAHYSKAHLLCSAIQQFINHKIHIHEVTY